MKLSALSEDNSRRDFLKKAGTTAATATINPIALKSVIGSAAASKYADTVKLFKSLSPDMQKRVESVTGWLTNKVDSNVNDINNFDDRRPLSSSHVAWTSDNENVPVGYFVKNGMIHWTDYEGNSKEVFPLRAIIGHNLLQQNNSPSDIINTWLSGVNPEILEKIQPSVVNDMLSVAINKSGGVRGFMKLIKDFQHFPATMAAAWGGVGTSSLNIWKLAIKHPLLQKVTGMSPASVQSAIKNGGKEMRQMVRNGMIDQPTALQHFRDQKQIHKFHKSEKEYRKRNLEREKDRQEQNKESERPEEYEIPKDYQAASPMHQWFEHKLNKALSGAVSLR